MTDKAIDIIIPYGGKVKWDHNELRYALRSIEKYLTGYGDIYIIGTTPDWLVIDHTVGTQCGSLKIPITKNIRAEDTPGRRQYSIFNKLILAAQNEQISNPFCVWNDDIFLTKPLHINDIKYWYSSDLKNLLIRSTGIYQTAISNTLKYLKDNNLPNKNFDIHVPILYEKEKLINLLQVDWKKDYIIKSLYCNSYHIKGEETRDLLFGRPFRREEIRSAINEQIKIVYNGEVILKDRQFFSINENGTNDAVKDILVELYNEKSKYEA